MRSHETQIKDAMVRVSTPTGAGAGFFIDGPDGQRSFEAGLLRLQGIEDLCFQTAEVVEAFGQFFEAVDWSERTESWVTPDY